MNTKETMKVSNCGIKKLFGRFSSLAALITALTFGNPALAVPITFDFDFFDSSGTLIGDGFYTFDDIAPGTKASFASLTNFSWGFSVPGLGLSLDSSAGDVPSTDSLTNEGILLTGAVGSRTLSFFDDVAVKILHQDISRAFPIGIEFDDGDPTAVTYVESVSAANIPRFSVGTFIAREVAAVPEPATVTLMGLALAGMGYRRRKATD